MNLETWFLFILVSLIPAISPGPGILLAINNTLRYGRAATIASATGNAAGLAVLGYGIALGLGAIMASSALVFTGVKLVGAGYLIYLGIKVWRDKTLLVPQVGSENTGMPKRRHLLGQAFLISVTNPKPIIVMAALFPQFISSQGSVLLQVTILSFTYAAICWLNHIVIAYAGDPLRRFIASPHRMKIVRRLFGSCFVGFGAALASTAR